ncbi:TIGR02757 family protein [Rufibacter roseus]|uniref:TIGR02757 family protein n=1 Tax=Rufibacter roseus TaxID=1567108 RepID=A0ABW2DN25_9BACT|nr:TIGR02757 family protein [Rufibacter roseus]
MHSQAQVKALLEDRYQRYNTIEFIAHDPVSVPHRFHEKRDVEISGFFASILAWGQRKTIINKCLELMQRMDYAPYQFVTQHQDEDLKQLLGFKHRTFNDTDLLYLVYFFKWFYERHESLEEAFLGSSGTEPSTQKERLEQFYNLMFSLPEAPHRTRKHISTPAKKSACKRINMYLRWMVRKDDCGVDFGLWNRIPAAELICPCDVHVQRVARRLGLITRSQSDWAMAEELTQNLRQFDPHDPVKYDYALFGLGIEEKF